jgi:hypothetical protein
MQAGRPERGQGAAGGVSRAVKLVLAVAGAIVTLTGAIAAVRQLVDHGAPAGGDARVSNVTVTGPASLAVYRMRQRIEPTADTGGATAIRLAATGSDALLAQETVTPTATPSETASPAVSPSPSVTVTPEVSPTVTPLGAGEVAVLCDPGVPAGGTDSCPAPREVDVCLPDEPQDSPLRCPGSVAGEQRSALDGPLDTTPPVIRRSVNMGLACERDALGSGCALSDAGPEPQTAAARRLAYEQIIRGIRSTRVRRGPHGRATPLGMIVSFDARLHGLVGKDVDVTWSVFAARTRERLNSDWFADRRAIVWHVESQDDQGSADIWIPLPPHRGAYFARISLRDASDGGRLTYARTPVFR